MDLDDLEQFRKLLEDFYKKGWEESYELFRRETQKLFLRRDTNQQYRPQLINDLEDLVSTVELRFVRVYRKLRDDGQEIRSFYGLLNDKVNDVYREWLRRKPPVSIDDPNHFIEPVKPESLDRELEENEERAIRLRCQKKALASLPEHILDLLLEYYSYEELPAKERTAARLDLALRQQNVSAEGLTPEQIHRLRNNLESKMSKWRNDVLVPREEECIKGEHSRLRKLF